MSKLSKRVVDAAVASAKRFIVWDDQLKGFGLLVLPSGVKSYIYNYRNAFNRERRLTIGKHGGGLTPDAARMLAEGFERDVAAGRDPLEAQRAKRQALTVGDLLDSYLSSAAFENKASSTKSIDRGRIEHHLRPTLGKLTLPALSPADVDRAHRAIVDGKTAVDKPSERKRGRIRVTGGDGSARMAVRLFRAILSWGNSQKIVPPDVVTVAKHVSVGRDGRRIGIIEDHDGYVRLFKALDRLTNPSALEVGERQLRLEVADAIRVLALSGARRGEVLDLRWSHVDLKAGLLTLPPDGHKTGRKTGERRVIGLPSLASAIIARQPSGTPTDLVFRPARGGAQMDLTKPWRAVCKAAGLPEGLGLHGLRHSLASHMAMEGAAASEIMAALGHRDLSTSQKYVHFAQDKRQALAEKAAKGISSAFAGVQDHDGTLVQLIKKG